MNISAKFDGSPSETELRQIASAVAKNAIDDSWLTLTFEMTYIDVGVSQEHFVQSDGRVEREYFDSDGLPGILSDQARNRIAKAGAIPWSGLSVNLRRESTQRDIEFDFAFSYAS